MYGQQMGSVEQPSLAKVDTLASRNDIGMMSTADGLLARLETLTLSGNADPLSLAQTEIADLLDASSEDAHATACTLSRIQGDFARRVEPSPTRSEIIDLIGDHVLKLIEPA